MRIFKRCGLDILTPEADSGIMGGKVSHEFMVPAVGGEDIVLVCKMCKYAKTQGEAKMDCPKCKVPLEKINAIEVGHIFKLGTKYSVSLGANFLDAKGKLQPIIMGCYGIGVSRLISAVIEENHDQDGIIWPRELSPYKVIIIALDVTDKNIMDLALSAYKDLQGFGIDVLLDDRDERAGVKFKDADLLGIPLQLIIGKGAAKDGSLELKNRLTQEKIIKLKAEILGEIKRQVNG